MKTRLIVSRFSKSLARRMRRAIGIKDEEGSSLVEFAVTLPALMLVLTGTASFSLALYFLQQIGNAATNAVQYVGAYADLDASITNPSTGAKNYSTEDPCMEAVSQVTAMLPQLSASKITYTLTIYYPNSTGTATTSTTYGPTTGNSFSCSAGSSYLTANYPVTLTVTYAYSWLPIYSYSPSSSLASSSTALAE